MPLAHVITANGAAGTVIWVPAAVAIGAIVVVAFGPRRIRRRATILSVAAMAVVLVLSILAPTPPRSPGFTLTMLQPAAGDVSSPFSVVACGHDSSGRSVDVPGGDRVLSVSLDGREIVSTAAATTLVSTTPGAHRVRIEVLTRDHVEFQPALVVEVQVDVTGPAPMRAPESCR